MYYSSNRKYIAIIFITFLTSFIARSGHNTPPPPKINYNTPHQEFTKKNILKIREACFAKIERFLLGDTPLTLLRGSLLL